MDDVDVPETIVVSALPIEQKSAIPASYLLPNEYHLYISPALHLYLASLEGGQDGPAGLAEHFGDEVLEEDSGEEL